MATVHLHHVQGFCLIITRPCQSLIQDGVRKFIPHCHLKKRSRRFRAFGWRAPDDGAPMMLVLCHQDAIWPITQTLNTLGTKVEPDHMAVTLFRGDQIIDTRDDFSRNVWRRQPIVHGAARPTIVFRPFFEDIRLATVRDGRTIDVIALTPDFKPDSGENFYVVSEIGLAGPAPLIAWKQKNGAGTSRHPSGCFR